MDADWLGDAGVVEDVWDGEMREGCDGGIEMLVNKAGSESSLTGGW